MRLIIFCAGGMSSSLLVRRVEDAAKAIDVDVVVSAHGAGKFSRFKGVPDVVLVAPQIRYAIKEIQRNLPGVPMEVIDMKAYGFGDGTKILEQALKLFEKL